MWKRRILKGTTALALVLAGMPVAAHAEPYDLRRLEAVAPGFAAGPAAQRRRLAAGLSLRVPLGNVRRSLVRESEVSFGFDLRTGGDSVGGSPVFTESRPLWRLSMTFEGPKTLALNGIRFAEMERLYAEEGEEGEDGGINWWKVAGWGFGGLLVYGIVAFAIVGDDFVPDFEPLPPQ